MTELAHGPFGLEMDAGWVVEQMTQAKGWEQRYRLLIQLGKKLPVMTDEQRSWATPIHGCESQAWLLREQDDQGQYWFALDSDARIVKGLMAVILAAANGKSGEQLGQIDWEHYFEQLGLLQHLSPSRGAGLKAIALAIKAGA